MLLLPEHDRLINQVLLLGAESGLAWHLLGSHSWHLSSLHHSNVVQKCCILIRGGRLIVSTSLILLRCRLGIVSGLLISNRVVLLLLSFVNFSRLLCVEYLVGNGVGLSLRSILLLFGLLVLGLSSGIV